MKPPAQVRAHGADETTASKREPGTAEASLVREITKRSGSNFYYAFLLLPQDKRQAIYAIYALSRAIDDAVDDAATPDQGRTNLARWREETRFLAEGSPRHAITRAVARARERFPIPISAIEALLQGAQMDLDRNRYETFGDLQSYCERVASSIGLMCIEIFGYRGAEAQRYATDLGIALQLTNILRDLGTDARRGRLYVPREDIERFGAREADLLAGRRTAEVLRLLGFEAERARSFYASAAASLDVKDRKSLLAAEVMHRIYRDLLARVERSSFDVFDRRIALSRPRRALLALSVLARTRFMPG